MIVFQLTSRLDIVGFNNEFKIEPDRFFKLPADIPKTDSPTKTSLADEKK